MEKRDHFQAETLIRLLKLAPRADLTVEQVCAEAGVSHQTVRGWLANGKDRPGSAFAVFRDQWYQRRPMRMARSDESRMESILGALEELGESAPLE